MAKLFQVIEFFDETGQEMVHRKPESGSGEFRLGDQLVVQESQAAVIFRDGKALDTFGPGRHTLSTANLPVLVTLLGKLFDGVSPFRVAVVYVNMREFIDMKWGTPEPIVFRDSDIGMVRLRAFGTFSSQISDPQLFVNKVVGSQGLYETAQIESFLKSILVTKLVDAMGESKKSVLDLPTSYIEIGGASRALARDDFAALGIDLKTFYVSAITPTEETAKAIDERAAMGAIGNMQAYLQFKAARALGDAALAGGPGVGGLAQAGMGLGAGVGMGAMMAGMMGQVVQAGMAGAGAQVTAPGAAAPGAAAPAAAGAAAAMMACPSCQAQIPQGSKFCANCGARIAGPLKCSNCGTELAPGSKFCNNCGTKVG
ncbi:MAG: SPFH domain-containing protein [Chloroflexota bacterium]